jgi:hypothetical protein
MGRGRMMLNEIIRRNPNKVVILRLDYATGGIYKGKRLPSINYGIYTRPDGAKALWAGHHVVSLEQYNHALKKYGESNYYG